jgi:hypothetical protein
VPKIATVDQIRLYLQALRDAPLRIRACTAGLDETRLRAAPAPKEWSAVEIMAHVRGSAEARTRTIHKMLALDNPKLAYVSPRGWVKKQKYDTLSFAENFRAYQVERANLIGVLEGLTSEQWNRSATMAGKANSLTVFSEAMGIAMHDMAHCNQLETMFSSRKPE